MDASHLVGNLLLNGLTNIVPTLREIEDLNNQRKLLTKQFMEDAMSKIDKSNNLIFCEGSSWIICTYGIIS
ncbi:MAG: hypothetical protein Q9M97_08950 [Candidatus Gracilibacteria bacterium]|nr:hypothetical protein [Candidatus Gracilibacteria bacterium]